MLGGGGMGNQMGKLSIAKKKKKNVCVELLWCLVEKYLQV